MTMTLPFMREELEHINRIAGQRFDAVMGHRSADKWKSNWCGAASEVRVCLDAGIPITDVKAETLRWDLTVGPWNVEVKSSHHVNPRWLWVSRVGVAPEVHWIVQLAPVRDWVPGRDVRFELDMDGHGAVEITPEVEMKYIGCLTLNEWLELRVQQDDGSWRVPVSMLRPINDFLERI